MDLLPSGSIAFNSNEYSQLLSEAVPTTSFTSFPSTSPNDSVQAGLINLNDYTLLPLNQYLYPSLPLWNAQDYLSSSFSTTNETAKHSPNQNYQNPCEFFDISSTTSNSTAIPFQNFPPPVIETPFDLNFNFEFNCSNSHYTPSSTATSSYSQPLNSTFSNLTSPTFSTINSDIEVESTNVSWDLNLPLFPENEATVEAVTIERGKKSKGVPERASKGKRIFKGYRAGVDSIELGAPIQTRNYALPSKTSRKVMPIGITRSLKSSRKRQALPTTSSSVSLSPLEVLSPDTEYSTRFENSVSLTLAIQSKREANTLAARKTRERKLAYLRELEEKNETNEFELMKSRQRVEILENRLRDEGLRWD